MAAGEPSRGELSVRGKRLFARLLEAEGGRMPGGPEFGEELFSCAQPLPCGGDGERAIIRGKATVAVLRLSITAGGPG